MFWEQFISGSLALGSCGSVSSSVGALIKRRRRQGRARRRFETSVSSESLETRVLLFALQSRWSSTATNGAGLGQGDATTVTWSIVADGTAMPASGFFAGESSAASNLVAFLSGIYGTVTADTNYTDEVWFSHFQSSFNRWSELSGVTYVYAAYDDGVAIDVFNGANGVLGVRADVRIGGHQIDGNNNYLAYNWYPDTGEMVIDTSDSFYSTTTGNSIRLRNTVTHEAGHGLGLDHITSSASAFLMEGNTSSAFDGPQFDDIVGIQRHYGDFYEKSGGNDTSGKATPLGSLVGGQTLSIGTSAVSTVVSAAVKDFVSIDDESDADFFSFTTSAAGTVNIQLSPVGPTYNVGPSGGSESSFNSSSQSNLTLQLLGTNGTTVLSTANSGGLGVSEAISSFAVPGAGTYYVKVSGATLNKIQTYRLDITDLASAALTVTLNTGSISEAAGAGAATGTVTRSGDLTSALVVTLASNDTTEATVSASVTIAAGQSSATFAIAAVDDAVVDGTQVVTLTASATSYASGTNTLNVTDNDVLTLTVSLNTGSVSETAGAGAATGTVFRNNGDLSSALVVTLASNDTTEATVPGSVTILAGQSSATFSIAAVDDAVVDGTLVVTFTASATSYVSGTSNLSVTDNDVLTLTVSLDTGSVSESAGAGAATGTVFRNNGDLTSALVVTLANNDTSEATVPASVTIAAGQSSATFAIAAIDDAIVDGTQVVTFTASATSYVSGTSNLSVTDNDVLTLTVSLNTGSVSESAGAGAANGTVSRNNDDLSSALVVTLASNDTTEATVAGSVTLLAGQSSATFSIAAVDDVIADGTQLVTFTGSATGFVSGTGNVNVTDDEVLPLPVITGPTTPVKSLRPLISWTASEGATSYEIWIKNQSTNTNPFHTATTTGTSYVPDIDLGIGKFNLWVRARGAQEYSPWTAQYNFTVSTAVTTNPIDRWQPTSRPAISWNPLPGAGKYDIWISDQLAGISPYIRNQNITETSFTPGSDMPLGLYRAWVRGISADGIGASWSLMSEFYVATAPTITSGTNSTFDRTPTFEWTTVTGAERYEVFVRNLTTGNLDYYPKTITDTNWTPPANLTDGAYRWWAMAVGAYNVRGLWTAPNDIHVGGRPKLLTPVGTVNNSTPTFSWQAVDGAVRYELWVTNANSNVRVIYETALTGLSFTPSSPLAQAGYRVWVRAVSITGEVSPWSVTVDFTVARVNSSGGDLQLFNDQWMVGFVMDELRLPSSGMSAAVNSPEEEPESPTGSEDQQFAREPAEPTAKLAQLVIGSRSSGKDGLAFPPADLERLWENAQNLDDLFTQLSDLWTDENLVLASNQL